MRTLHFWLVCTALGSAACGSTTNADASGTTDTATCTDDACADATADGGVDAQDTTGAQDLILNDVAAGDTAPKDAVDATGGDAVTADSADVLQMWLATQPVEAMPAATRTWTGATRT